MSQFANHELEVEEEGLSVIFFSCSAFDPKNTFIFLQKYFLEILIQEFSNLEDRLSAVVVVEKLQTPKPKVLSVIVDLNLANLFVHWQHEQFDFSILEIVAIFQHSSVHLQLCPETIAEHKVEVDACVLNSHQLQIMYQTLLFGQAPLILHFLRGENKRKESLVVRFKLGAVFH